MTVTATQKGKFMYIISDSGTVSGAVQELILHMSNHKIPYHKIVLLDATNKLAVYQP